MTTAKIQHYVPQFLLRNFGNGKKDQVWVYDKSSNRTFPSNTKNVASESRFYDFEHKGQTVTIENWLSALEGKAKSIIDEILAKDSLAGLTDEQRMTLASFLAVQLTRTKTFREEWNAFPTMLRERLGRAGDQVAPGSQAEELLRELTENESKEQTARMTFEAPLTYAAYFLDKDWALAATSRKHPFLISDNPLTRQNLVSLPNRGNLGLKTPGIEIYLPLSPTRALAMWCPTLTELVHRGSLLLINQRGSREKAAENDPDGVMSMSEALLNGTPLQYNFANVENFNSLQVFWSERYIFSTLDDFRLAQSMIDENASRRNGPRSSVA